MQFKNVWKFKETFLIGSEDNGNTQNFHKNESVMFYRDVFMILSKINNGAFFAKTYSDFYREVFLQKSSIIDVWQKFLRSNWAKFVSSTMLYSNKRYTVYLTH